ncbi:hypothetical protein GCM10027030_04020 [Luteococcus sediminum]
MTTRRPLRSLLSPIGWAAVLAWLWGIVSGLAQMSAGPDVVRAAWPALPVAAGLLVLFLATKGWPVVCYLLLQAVMVGLSSRPDSWGMVSGALVTVAGYHLGRRAPARLALSLGVLVALLTAGAQVWGYRQMLDQSGETGEVEATLGSWGRMFLQSVPGQVTWTLLPIVAGAVVRHQLREAEETVRVAEAAAAEADRRLAEALRTDREGLARELHDLAAHHTTAAVIGAKAARKAGAQRPEAVGELIDGVVEQTQAAQSSLRQMVDVLRHPDEDAPLVPQPTLDEIPALVEHARRVNPDILLSIDSDEVPPAVSLAAYRIVQESLTNAHRHATRAPVTIDIWQQERSLWVQVVNGASSMLPEDFEGSGRGILGMRQRAELLGGGLEAGPHGRGWRVLAELGLDEPVSPSEVETDGEVEG